MADETFEWDLQFNLTGDGLAKGTAGLQQFHGALQKGQRAILEFEQGGQKIKATFEAVGGAADKAKAAMGGFVTTLGDVFHAAQGLLDAIKKPFELLDSFGDKAIDAFSERASSLRAYTALLGDAKQATEEFGKAQALSLKLPFLSTDIEAAQKQLIVAGLRNEGGQAGGSLDKNLLTVADYASLSHDKGQALRTGTHAVAEVYERGHLSERQAQQISQDLGVSLSILKENIRTSLGLGKGADIDKLISKKGVSAEVFGSAFQATKAQQLGGSALGDIATSGAGDLQTLLINKSEQLKNLEKTVNSDLLPGVEKYKAALQSQAEVFNVATDKGKQMSLTVQALANDSLLFKSAWTDFESSFFTSFSESFLQATKEAGDQSTALDSASAAMKRAGELAGKLGGPLGQMASSFEALGPLITVVSVALTTVASAFDLIGTQIGTTLGLLYEAVTDPVHIRDHIRNFGAQTADEFSKLAHNIAASAGAGGQPAGKGASPVSLSGGGDFGLDGAGPGRTKGTRGGGEGRGGGAGGGESGTPVPYARGFTPAYAAPARFGASLAEGARAAVEAGQQKTAAAPPTPIDKIEINITIDGAKHSDKDLAQLVGDTVDDHLRSLWRGLRGPSPRRV